MEENKGARGMNINIIARGFFSLLPSLSVIIVLSGVGIILFLGGRATALRHLIKHHLQDIAGDEIKSLIEQHKIDTITIERLKTDNRYYVDTLSGVRHLVRKEIR